jgi:hypothetical protein
MRRFSVAGALRRFRVARAAVCLVAAVALAAAAGAQPGPAKRIVAVGDIHGDYDAFVGVLQRVGLIDAAKAWTGGPAVLVQTGDYTDRGPKVREAMDLLMSLEEQAGKSRGQALVLLGIHEAMQVLGDRRYVTPEIYASFADGESGRRREEAWKALERLSARRRRDLADANLPVPAVYATRERDAWMADHPPGTFEYVEAMGPRGRYGRWIRRRQAVVKVGDTVFLHGGLDSSIPGSLEDISRRVRDEMTAFDRLVQQLISDQFALPFFTLEETLEAARTAVALASGKSTDGGADPQRAGVAPSLPPYAALLDIGSWYLVNPEGPLWFRGYATWTNTEGPDRLAPVLARHGAARVVVGHTVLSTNRITPRFDNRVFLIDTGMLATWFKGGRGSALEIQGSEITAVYDDGRVPLAKESDR